MAGLHVEGQAQAAERQPAQLGMLGRFLTRAARFLVPSMITAILGSAAVMYGMRWGPWAFSDGAGYVMLARNLLLGRGLGLVRASGEFQPLSMHPPLYPLTLAALGGLQADLLSAAKWLNAGFFGLSIILAAGIIYFISGKGWLGLLAGAVVLTSPQLIQLFTGMLSEPLFFASFLATLLLLLAHWRDRRAWTLVGAGASAAIGLLTRYPGAALVAACAAGILVFGRPGRRRRLVDAITFLAVALLPSMLWLAWMAAQPGGDPPREWLWDLSTIWERTRPIRGSLVQSLWAWTPIGDWMARQAYRARLLLLFVPALLIGVIAVAALRRVFREPQPDWREHSGVQLIVALGAFVISYLALFVTVFLFSRSPLDAADLDQRMLSPVYLSLALSGFAVLALMLQAWPNARWVPALGVALALAAILNNTLEAWDRLQALHQEGAGYTGKSWQTSETLAAVLDLPDDVPLVSNEGVALAFHLDRPAYEVPELSGSPPLDSSARFGDGGSEVELVFRESGAALVLFDSMRWQLRQVHGAGAEARLESLVNGLELIADLADGTIYFYPEEDNLSH